MTAAPAATVLAAAPAADTLFPAETVGFLSVANPDELSEHFDRTQIGQLVADASMEEFARYLRNETVNRVGDIENRLALSVDDLFAAAGGELALGFLHREGAKAALAVTIDVTGKQAEADALLAKVRKDLEGRGGKRSTEDRDGVTVIQYDLPPREPKPGQRAVGPSTVVCFQRDQLLVAVDQPAEAERLLAAAKNGAPKPLAGVNAYQQVLKKATRGAARDRADVRWYIDPFAFDTARDSMQLPQFMKESEDLMKVLAENGFLAMQGIGGVMALSLDAERDLVHRTAFYAPGKTGAGGDPADRFDGAMRIMDAPNRSPMDMEPWAPRGVARYNTINLNVQSVFDNLAPLFDAAAGYEDAFKTTLEGFEKDPFGPKIKIREQLIAHLGSRVTMMSDYNLPIDPDAERYLFVFEVANEKALRGPLDKLMESDGAQRRELNGIEYWEVLPEEDEGGDMGDGLPEFDDPLFDDPIGDAAASATPNEQHSAVSLHQGQLVIASDVEFLKQTLFGPQPNEALAGCEDYRYAAAQLDKLAPWKRCAWSFVRNDETVRASYELVRAGKMPESRTFFGQMINRALTTPKDEEKGIVREQRLDGSKMPEYELVRRYLGPSVRALRTDTDGWLLVGVLLNKSGQ